MDISLLIATISLIQSTIVTIILIIINKEKIMNFFCKPKIIANPNIHIFKWHKSTKQKPRHVKILRFQVGNEGRWKAKDCGVDVKIEPNKHMKEPELASWEKGLLIEEKKKVTHFKGNKDEFVNAVYDQWLKWDQHKTILGKTEPKPYFNLMIFVENEDHGYLITRLKTYKIKFRAKPYTLTLKFSVEDHERKYDLKLTSYVKLGQKSINEIKPNDS